MSNTILPRQARTGTRTYVRALASSQGYHMTEIGASTDGAEFLDLQEQHDRVSDLFHKRADDELVIARTERDPRRKDSHIKASMNLRAEAYRFEALEDDRRVQAQASLVEAREAGVAGSQTCDDALRLNGACEHGKAA